MRYLAFILLIAIFSMKVSADEPARIVRHLGPAGVASRIESKSSKGKTNTVKVTFKAVAGSIAIQDRITIEGSDIFRTAPKPERNVKPKPPKLDSVKAAETIKVK